MAQLRFYFGTMGSGKSTLALQIHHNLGTTGGNGLLCTVHDRLDAAVSSRLGVAQPAIVVHPDVDLVDLARDVMDEHGSLDFMVCDEAQFYTPTQIEQLADVVDELGVDVFAFGLLTDFRGLLFPATARLIEMSDVRIEMQVEARCWCGRQATHNARIVGGVQVYEGELIVVGDTPKPDAEPQEVTYEWLCRHHWRLGETSKPAD